LTQVQALVSSAAQLLRDGRLVAAEDLLTKLVAASPGFAPAHYLLGVARGKAGDAAGARERLARALKLAPESQEAAIELARLLNAYGLHRECIEVTTPASSVAKPQEALLVERARAFQALDRADERLAERERIAQLYPAKPAVHHNLAAALGDAGYPERAEMAARQCLAQGGNAPETWLVLARALQSQNRLDAAEAGFGEALRRRPGYLPVLRDLSQLVWMRTGDLDRALTVLKASENAVPPGQLTPLLARLFEAADEAKRGYDTLVAGRMSDDAEIELVACRLAIGFDARQALAHARRAEALLPASKAVKRQLVDALLAADMPREGLETAQALLQDQPLDQGLIACCWLAWRMLGDERAAQLYDYSACVMGQMIDTPAGWGSLDEYLQELAALLRSLHGFCAHPLDQSLRFGTQTSANLLTLDHPAIRAFRDAIDRPIRHYLSFLGTGTDPLRSRNAGNYRFSGMWSVRLQPGGFHVSHVHPMGWISSACYIDLPGSIGSDTQEGWIKFGEPGIPIHPHLPAEHRIQPREGMLVLFPSYMWHGTERTRAEGSRLTIAFDLVPA